MVEMCSHVREEGWLEAKVVLEGDEAEEAHLSYQSTSSNNKI